MLFSEGMNLGGGNKDLGGESTGETFPGGGGTSKFLASGGGTPPSYQWRKPREK